MKSLGSLSARPLSPNTLIVMAAVFVALFANTALFRSAFTVYDGGAEQTLFVVSLLPFMAATFVLILSALCHRSAAKPVLIAFFASEFADRVFS